MNLYVPAAAGVNVNTPVPETMLKSPSPAFAVTAPPASTAVAL